jgi:alkanesulfonate monooxygenase SsuD/methylene tetrahydromethanopterin reductase-like flavin-dependent oxidoreductase (luciferase family)
MTRLAGELAQGLVVHGLKPQPYFDEVTAVALERGLADSGRDRASIEVSTTLFLLMGDTTEEIERMRQLARQRIAFYASTPTYRPLLEHIEYGGLQPMLNSLATRGRWRAMAEAIDDELLDSCSLSGPPEAMANLVSERFGNRLDRVASFYGWPVDDPERTREIVRSFEAS